MKDDGEVVASVARGQVSPAVFSSSTSVAVHGDASPFMLRPPSLDHNFADAFPLSNPCLPDCNSSEGNQRVVPQTDHRREQLSRNPAVSFFKLQSNQNIKVTVETTHGVDATIRPEFEHTFVTRKRAEELRLPIRPWPLEKRTPYPTPVGQLVPYGYAEARVEAAFEGIGSVLTRILVLSVEGGSSSYIVLGQSFFEEAFNLASKNKQEAVQTETKVKSKTQQTMPISTMGWNNGLQENPTVEQQTYGVERTLGGNVGAAKPQIHPGGGTPNTVANNSFLTPYPVNPSRHSSFSGTYSQISPISSVAFTEPVISSTTSQMGNLSWGKSSEPPRPAQPLGLNAMDHGTIVPRMLHLPIAPSSQEAWLSSASPCFAGSPFDTGQGQTLYNASTAQHNGQQAYAAHAPQLHDGTQAASGDQSPHHVYQQQQQPSWPAQDGRGGN